MPPKPTKRKTPAAQTAGVSSANPTQTIERNKQMDSKAQTQNALSLIIGDVTICQDENGRYSLNDIQRAAVLAGVTKDIRPAKWLALDQTKELIEALITQNCVIKPVNVVPGRYGGTYVVRELVYSYSMWVDAKVNLGVIQGFDSMVTHGAPQNFSINMSMTNWLQSLAMGNSLMKALSSCNDLGVAEGQYGRLLAVNRACGLATPPLDRLAPNLRQQFLDFDSLDRSEGGAA